MKNNRVDRIGDGEDLARITDAAQMYYVEGYKEKQIGRALGCSGMTVSRLLKRARDQNIVEIKINRHHAETIRQKLMERFDLIEARLAPSAPNDDEARELTASEAARYFDEIVKSNMTVGISGGRTIHKMIDLVAPKTRRVKIYPLTGIWRDLQISYVDSGVLVHSLWLKCMDAADAFWFPIEPLATHSRKSDFSAQRGKYLKNRQVKVLYHEANHVDIAIVGVGPLRTNSSTIRQLESIGITRDYLRKLGAVGIAAGVWYNSQAQPVIDDYFLSVPLRAFRKLAKQANKKVIIVAGGDEKLEALRVLLEHHVCNVLITDTRTGSQLVQ